MSGPASPTRVGRVLDDEVPVRAGWLLWLAINALARIADGLPGNWELIVAVLHVVAVALALRMIATALVARWNRG